MPDPFDHRETLDALRPTALVVGHDVVCAVRWADELHKLLHGSRLLLLERSRHVGHVEDPESSTRELTASPPPSSPTTGRHL